MPPRLPLKCRARVQPRVSEVLALGGAECLSREARKRSKIEGEDDHFQQVEGLAGQAAVQSAVKSCGLRDLQIDQDPERQTWASATPAHVRFQSTDTEIRKKKVQATTLRGNS